MKHQRTIDGYSSVDHRLTRQAYITDNFPETDSWTFQYHLGSVAYYSKEQLNLLKQNMAFPSSLVKLPESKGKMFQLYQYSPVIKEYADYASFSDLSLDSSVDDVVSMTATEIVEKYALTAKDFKLDISPETG